MCSFLYLETKDGSAARRWENELLRIGGGREKFVAL